MIIKHTKESITLGKSKFLKLHPCNHGFKVEQLTVIDQYGNKKEIESWKAV